MNIPATLSAHLLDYFLPSLCAHCDKPSSNICCGIVLCEDCTRFAWNETRCPRCGVSAHNLIKFRGRCFQCRNIPLPWKSYSCIGNYDSWLRTAILGIKFANDPLAFRFLSNLSVSLLAGAGKVDAICYVPSHPKRMRERRKARQHLPGLLHPLSKKAGCPLLHLLKRVEYNKSQAEATHKERLAAVQNAFVTTQVPPKRILLIDDVFTTGSTLRECARVLKASGAKTVHARTFAFRERKEFFLDGRHEAG